MDKKKIKNSKSNINDKNDIKFILVLDLDETLFHTNRNKLYIRPYVKDFINTLKKYFYLVVFTAATKSYADEILKQIDIYDCFIKKFYRSSLSQNGRIKDLKTVIRELVVDKIKYKSKGGILKDNALKILNMNNKLLIKKNNIHLDKILLIDNLGENLCSEQKNNGIIIKDYDLEYLNENKNDNTLLILKEFLLHMININPSNVQDYLRSNLYIVGNCVKYVPEHPLINVVSKPKKQNLNTKTSIKKKKKNKSSF